MVDQPIPEPRIEIMVTWGERDNPNGLPANRPAEIREVSADTPLSARVLTLAQYNALVASTDAEYEAAMAPIVAQDEIDAAAAETMRKAKDEYVSLLFKRDILGLDSAATELQALAARVQTKTANVSPAVLVKP